jgi:hypothetical protein
MAWNQPRRKINRVADPVIGFARILKRVRVRGEDGAKARTARSRSDYRLAIPARLDVGSNFYENTIASLRATLRGKRTHTPCSNYFLIYVSYLEAPLALPGRELRLTTLLIAFVVSKLVPPLGLFLYLFAIAGAPNVKVAQAQVYGPSYPLVFFKGKVKCT